MIMVMISALALMNSHIAFDPAGCEVKNLTLWWSMIWELSGFPCKPIRPQYWHFSVSFLQLETITTGNNCKCHDARLWKVSLVELFDKVANLPYVMMLLGGWVAGLNIAWWVGGGLKLPDVMILLGVWWVKACGVWEAKMPTRSQLYHITC